MGGFTTRKKFLLLSKRTFYDSWRKLYPFVKRKQVWNRGVKTNFDSIIIFTICLMTTKISENENVLNDAALSLKTSCFVNAWYVWYESTWRSRTCWFWIHYMRLLPTYFVSNLIMRRNWNVEMLIFQRYRSINQQLMRDGYLTNRF